MLYCNHQPLWAYGYGYSFRLSRFPLLASGPESDTTAQQHCRGTPRCGRKRARSTFHTAREENRDTFFFPFDEAFGKYRISTIFCFYWGKNYEICTVASCSSRLLRRIQCTVMAATAKTMPCPLQVKNRCNFLF